ncbi:hypothetical protein GCM10007242_17380 [Pigmentiphaga litoralis]|uniref:hypothetical protein n=1 Tax=Pigmentiphaga litoralis TaxID=516702 RepID=UPI0016729CB8|nr:hypothetical protein [Pigmentiphaga litoralis]GGX11734.1 hypothetical protein GCM10007242_17380 [Pigmentiphaga litoralis]
MSTKSPSEGNATEDAGTARGTTPGKPKDGEGKDARTIGNHPTDPNALGAKANFPPGVSAEEAHDPGNQVKSGPKVENRS